MEEEKDAFEFEDTGFHEQPKIPEPPSLKEMGIDSGEADAVAIEEIPEEISGPAISAAPSAPPVSKPSETAPPPSPVVSSEKGLTPVDQTAPSHDVTKPPSKPPIPKPPVKPKAAPKPVKKPITRPRPVSRRVEQRGPTSPPPVVESVPRPAPTAPPSTPVTKPKTSKIPWVIVLLLIVGCAFLGFLLWQRTKDVEQTKQEMEEAVQIAEQNAQKKIDDYKKKIGELEKQISTLKKEKLSLESEKNELVKRLRTKEQSIKDLATRVTDLRKKLDTFDDMRMRISELEKELKTKDMTLDAQRKLAEEAEKKRLEAEKKLIKYQNAFARLADELKNAEREIERLKKYGTGDVARRFAREKAKLLRRIKDLEEENARLQEQLVSSEVTAPTSTLRNRIKGLRRKLAKMALERASLRESLMRMNERLKRYISPVETLEKWLAAVKAHDIRRVAALYSRKSDFWKRWTGPERQSLEREFQDASFKGIEDMEILSVVIEGGRSVAVVVLKAKGGRTYKGSFTLVLEGDVWRIMSEEF